MRRGRPGFEGGVFRNADGQRQHDAGRNTAGTRRHSGARRRTKAASTRKLFVIGEKQQDKGDGGGKEGKDDENNDDGDDGGDAEARVPESPVEFKADVLADGLHFPPSLSKEWNPKGKTTAAHRAEAALGSFIITALMAPFFYLLCFAALDRYGAKLAERSARDIIITFMVLSTTALFCFIYSCIGSFHGRRGLDPSFAAPRLTLFLEIHPVSWVVPIVSYLRGFIGYSFVRWALNVTAMVLLVLGHTVLRPAYLDACCYGEDVLEDEKVGSCTDRTLRNGLGVEICDPDGYSDEHKTYIQVALILIAVSATMQLLNIMTVDWDVINRIGELQREIAMGGLRVNYRRGQTKDDPEMTVNLRLVMQLLGLPERLEKLCFPGYNAPALSTTTDPFELIRRRQKRLHEHPHWAHPGLLRLLCLDPVFGFVLSVQDFVAYHDLRGTVRIFLNIFGAGLCVLAVEILQPMHRAWCCYGAGEKIWKTQVNGSYYTCLELADKGVESAFFNSPQFPNGECMRYNSLGLAAAVALATGLACLIFSTLLWVYTFVAAEDACQRIAHNCARLVRPSERFLLLQIYDWIGITHGKIKLV